MQLQVFGKEIEFNPNTLEPCCKARMPEVDKFMSLCFQVTYRCNLQCQYCFVPSYPHKNQEDMTLEVAKKAINNFAKKGCTIGFFGGEPLLNFSLIHDIVNYTKQKSSHVTTNGTLINMTMAKFFKEHNFSYILSLEGNEETHNASRPHKTEKNSFQLSMQGLEILKQFYPESPIPLTLRSTYTLDDKALDLVARLKFLNDFVEKGYATHVSVEPATGIASFHDMGKVDKEFYKTQYFQAAQWCLAYYREKGKLPRYHHLTYFIEKIIIPQICKITECGPGKGYASIATDGTIFPCHREEVESIGHVNTGIDKKKQRQWLDNTYFQKEQCSSCWNRNFCGGGCRVNAYLANGDIQKPSQAECFFKKLYTKMVIWFWTSLSQPEKALLKTRAELMKTKNELRKWKPQQRITSCKM